MHCYYIYYLSIFIILFSYTNSQTPICKPTGCSGQICADNDIITTCEYRSEYECYRSAKCERQTNGECGWTMNESLKKCLTSSTSASSCFDTLTKCKTNVDCCKSKCYKRQGKDGVCMHPNKTIPCKGCLSTTCEENLDCCNCQCTDGLCLLPCCPPVIRPGNPPCRDCGFRG
ncbi:unnamed protein product [Didymodactylos carnosus]|uniref:Uncharacterized protein n=1 Tax=Didymodactylos carnosus TaxID=1234261 RepID=A0A814JNK3_9BILA|nr:unnamed protein product [Didymodactylos carnosus]CAF3810474.1 unnamed protein product [Didymodactylos carnosus]